LAQTNQDLPSLQEKLKRDLKREISSLLAQVNFFLKEAEESHGDSFLTRADDFLRKLNEYRILKQYTNPNENQRIVDLATLYQRHSAAQQYPRILSDYPATVKQIESLQQELNLVSEAVQQLNTLKMRLQKSQAMLLSKEKVAVHPFQTRFIDAF